MYYNFYLKVLITFYSLQEVLEVFTKNIESQINMSQHDSETFTSSCDFHICIVNVRFQLFICIVVTVHY